MKPADLLPLVLLLALAGCASTRGRAPSPADRSAVLATVQAFFDAMRTRDVAAAERVVVPDGAFVSTRVEDGKRVERHFTNREWLAELGRETTLLEERFTGDVTVVLEGDLAVVFGPYAFDRDGRPSHTGFDAFNLIRTDDGWRISGGAYSVVRAN